MAESRRSLPIINTKRAPSRRKQALAIHTGDLEQMPLERYVELQKSIGRLWSIGSVDVDVDQLVLRKFLCDRHRCIQWTPHERKKDAKPIIDRSCCSSYSVPLTESDRKKVEEILPLVRKRLDKNHALVTDEDEPFYDIEDDFSLALRETDRGTCEFVLYDEGLTTCAVHKTCLEEGLDVWDYKPIGCSLWPVAVIDYDVGDDKRFLVTAYTAQTNGLFDNASADPEGDGEDKFACIVDDNERYDSLYKSQEGILRYLLGDAFYDELHSRSVKYLADKAKKKRS